MLGVSAQTDIKGAAIGVRKSAGVRNDGIALPPSDGEAFVKILHDIGAFLAGFLDIIENRGGFVAVRSGAGEIVA